MSLISDVARVVRFVPGVGLAERGLGTMERVVLRGLQHRLDRLAAADPAGALGPGGPPGRNGAPPGLPPPATLGERMQQLLRISMDLTPTDSRRRLFEHILDELVPDEARIVAALADGSFYPVITVIAS